MNLSLQKVIIIIIIITRFLFGALKSAVSHYVDTDNMRAGWLSPSEVGGSLDYTRNDNCGTISDIDRAERHNSNSDLHFQSNDNINHDVNSLYEVKDTDLVGDDCADKAIDGSISNEIMSKEQESNNLHLLYFINSLQSVKNEKKRTFNETNQVNEDIDVKKNRNNQIGEDGDCKIGKGSNGVEDKDEIDSEDNYNVENFLKRFINAVIKPEMIEKFLNESM
jgi:hypothetical protein